MSPARLVGAVLLVATALPLGATAQPSIACPAKVSPTPDGWRRIASPFGAQRALAAYAVTPTDASTMLATDGTSVLRTRDGGCTWTSLYTLAQPSADIVDIVASKQRLYLLLNDITGTRVLVSADDGASWKNATLPVSEPVSEHPPKLVVDLSGMYAYVTLRVTTAVFGGGEVIYASEDGGTTWSPRPIANDPSGAVAQITDLAADPLLGADVWLTTTSGVFRSGDAGKSWTYTTVADRVGQFGPIAVVRRPDAPVLVAVALLTDAVVHVRRMGGGWTTVNTPGLVTSIAGGRTWAQVAITTAAGTYELDYDALTWSPMHRGTPALSRLSTDYTSNASFYACACGTRNDAIWTRTPRAFDGYRAPERGADNQVSPGFNGCAPTKHEPDPAGFAPSAITGTTDEITLAPGQSVNVPYTFRVQPRELDVYFLAATGPRTGALSCTIKQGAIWSAYQLARDHNLRVGLGQYRDYPVSGGLAAENPVNCLGVRNDFVYRRDLRIGPVDGVFKDAVSAIGFGRDTCTADHAALSALLQAAGGPGQDVAPRGPSPYDIAPGQDAVFSPDAYKVILLVTGGTFSSPGKVAGYPGPEFEPVIAALAENGIKQIGIAVPFTSSKKHHGEPPPPPPAESSEPDMRRVARETGTLAAAPVDCGNRVPSRIAAGEPLVCMFLNGGRREDDGPPMGTLIRDLVNALRDVQPMRLTVLSGDARLAPNLTRRLDHLRAQTLQYTATFACAPEDAGLVKEVRLGGEVGSTVVATTTATVRCGGAPVQRRTDVVLPPPIGHVAGTAAAPVANTNLALNTATQPQGQMQQIMQGAAMRQEDAQQHLAYNDLRLPDDNEDLAMTALPPPRATVPPWAMAEVAGVMMLAASWAMSRRLALNTRGKPAR